MTCGMCGYHFDANDAVSYCRGCPLAGPCALVCCPRCGYETPPEPRLVRWARRFLQQRKRAAWDVRHQEKSQP